MWLLIVSVIAVLINISLGAVAATIFGSRDGGSKFNLGEIESENMQRKSWI